MTKTQTTSPRHQIRLASMSTADLQNLAGAPRLYDYTAEDIARTDRTLALVRGELARREAAGGRQVEEA